MIHVFYQNKDWVCRQPMSLLLSLHTKWEERRKKEAGAGGGAAYRLDSFPPPTAYAAMVDNHRDQLHPARLDRHPPGSRAELWEQMPVWRTHTYRSIDLRPFGINSQVAEEALGILHDRRIMLKLKYFTRYNANIGSRGLKTKTDHYADGGTSSTSHLDWKELSNMRGVQDALINFAICNALLWPLDLTGLVLMKVLNDYLMLPNAQERVRVQVITALFERISNTNRKRTVRPEAPMDHREVEMELKVVLREHGLSELPATAFDEPIPRVSPDQRSLVNLQANLPKPQSGGNKANPKRSAAPSKRQLATVKSPSGHFVCYNWNNGTCTRQRTSGGCKDSVSNKEFSHCCLHMDPSTGAYCLLKHAKKDHR